MYINHPAARRLASMGVLKPLPTRAVLDSAAAAKEAEEKAAKEATLDAAGEHAVNAVRSQAVTSLVEWLGTSDLDDGETLADRFFAMMVGLADDNKDGDISEDEAEVIGVGLDAVADYLAAKGVTDDDITAFIDDGDDDAAQRVRELLQGEVSDDDADDDIDKFVFDAESSQSVMDSVLDSVTTEPKLDAVYKKKIVVRKGKKMRVNKRVSGRVRLSAKQKVAIRKAQRRANTGAAKIRRMRSMKIRRNAGL